ncbi:hypothetical protein EfmAA242_31380 (plasmid) [Enterococcus faecium]|nr:hypothetical protein EfmAA242_31380 [Enterococcus faecium]
MYDYILVNTFKYEKRIDDITFAELMDPALTTIRLNPGNKGAIAFHQLIGLAKQEEIKNQVLLLEGELISRDSVHKIK